MEHYQERRRVNLTEEDIAAIAAAVKCGKCAFTNDEAATLKKFASGVNRTERIASWIIITGIVGTILSGMWMAIKFYFTNVILKGGPHG